MAVDSGLFVVPAVAAAMLDELPSLAQSDMDSGLWYEVIDLLPVLFSIPIGKETRSRLLFCGKDSTAHSPSCLKANHPPPSTVTESKRTLIISTSYERPAGLL